MKQRLAFTTSAVVLIVVAAAHANSTGFQGPYSQDTWTSTGAGLGGSSVDFATDGSELVLTSADGGFGATTKVTHTVLAEGLWSFDWSFSTPDPNFELAYYTINGVTFDISLFSGSSSGHIDLAVVAGDVIGWQVVSVDGVFGPGYLTITDFRAPVPGPAALALLGLAAVMRQPFGGRIRRPRAP